MTCKGTIDGRYLSVSMLNRDGRILVFRGDQLGISEVDCPGIGGEECPVCGRLEAPWRKGDEPHLAPCELADEGSQWAPQPAYRSMLTPRDLTVSEVGKWPVTRLMIVACEDPIARVRRAYDVLGIERDAT